MEKFVDEVIREVAELGDRSSPDDWPEAMLVTGAELKSIIEAALDDYNLVPKGTPSSRWAVEGQPDPHDNIYNCERAALTMGDLTDDELANAAFLNYDRWPRLEDIIAGKAHPPIAYMTAVKERIRWLSRKLEEATKSAR